MELSRRELLASFLGLAAAQGCRRSVRRAPIPGAIVDRAVEAGHQLRSPGLPRASVPPAPVEVLVVGAGAAGLSAGWRLAAAGVSFQVVELDEAPGGTARSGRNEVSAFPWGAHYLPAPLRPRGPLARLLREVGAWVDTGPDGRPVYAEEMLVREPQERVFYKGTWYEGLYLHAGASPEDLAELERFQRQVALLSAARDARGRKAFDVPTAYASEDAEWLGLDRLSMAEWLHREGFSSPRLQWLVAYACRDDYGTALEDTSAWAGLCYFAARQDGAELHQGHLTWPEGNGRLVEQLARAVGRQRLVLSSLVHALEPVEGGWVAHAVHARTGAPMAWFARQVVLAAPRFVAARVLLPWRASPPDFLSAFQYSPWAVANLTLSAPPRSRGFPLAWDNVLYESQSLGYTVATHQAARAHEGGPTVLTWYYPFSGADPRKQRERLLSLSYADWEALVMADLGPAHPGLEALCTRLEVMRWGHAMVRPSPGLRTSGALARARESLGPSLHFAHSDLGGMALFEEANYFGVQAAERALAGLGKRIESWL